MQVPQPAPGGASHFTSLNASIQAMSVGRHFLECKFFKSPEPSFRARTASAADIQRIASSLFRTQSVHQNCVVACFFPEGKRIPSIDDVNLNDPVAMESLGADGFYFVVGDHTQQAVKILHLRRPKSVLWKGVTAEVLFCHRTRESMQVLKSWGILDNIKGETRTKFSFVNKVESLHEDCAKWPE